MTGVVQQEANLEKQIEKQMGCMAGFFQIFDRHQILTGKRLYSNKRLPPSAVADSAPELEKKTIDSPAKIAPESEKQQRQYESRSMPSTDKFKQSPAVLPEPRSPAPEVSPPAETPPSKSPLPLPVFDKTKSSSWKFSKEAPRLSLDSRATVDAKGRLKPRELRTNAAMLSAKNRDNVGGGEEADDSERQQNRSPSVIAKLMGLERLPESDLEDPAEKQPELRRSASESRANRDLLQYRFIDGVNFQLKQSAQSPHKQNLQQNSTARDSLAKDQLGIPKEYNAVRHGRVETVARQPNRGIAQRKSFFDSADFFPEPKQTVSIYGEIEKRLRMRGIDEPSKDLETLKQILEALQLKGLLHSTKPQMANQIGSRNFVYDGGFEDSPIVVMRPARSTSPMSRGRIRSDSPPASFRARHGLRRDSSFSSEPSPAVSPRRDRAEIERNARSNARGRNSSSPTRSESGAKGPLRRRPLSVETQRRIGNDSVEQRRVSPVQSPKIGSRRVGSDHQTTNQSRRNRRRPAAEVRRKEDNKVFSPTEDESSTVSESSFSATSHSDAAERPRAEEYKEGRDILERCDKLLHSIAEMTAATAELQPSPVSVLDSSFYKEESSPSPVMKRNVDFKGQFLTESDDDIWSPVPAASAAAQSDDCEFTYVSDVLRASTYLPEDSDVFLLLEKQQYLRGKDTSKVSRLQRRLTFDTINEILEKKRELPPWKAVSSSRSAAGTGLQQEAVSLNQIWSEFQRIQVREDSSSSADDLFEVICGVLRKDLARDAVTGWEDCPVEMSEAVLDIERLIFKDLIGETIQDLATFAGTCSRQAQAQAQSQTALASFPRRKLVF